MGNLFMGFVCKNRDKPCFSLVMYGFCSFNVLYSIKWSNTLKQFICNFLMNCLNVFDHFVKLVFKGLIFFGSRGAVFKTTK